MELKMKFIKVLFLLCLINFCSANYSNSKFSIRSLQAVSSSSYVAPVDNIPAGTILTSENGFWILKLTDTGFLQVQDSFGNILYSLNTSITGTAPFKMRFGTDAKINLLDSLNSVKYSSSPSTPSGGVYRLILQNDGQLIVKQASNNVIIWYGKSTHNLSSDWPSQGSMNIFTSSNFGEFSLTDMYTNYNLEGDWDIFYLERHTLDCGDKAAMNFFVLQRMSPNYRFFYKCIKSDNISTSCTNHSTALNSVASDYRYSLNFLDRHTLNCDTGKVLKGFKVTRSGNQLKYDYTCCTAKIDGECTSSSTGSSDANNWHTIYLDRQTVNAGTGKVFKSFQLRAINGDFWNNDRIYYSYTSCNLSTIFNTDSDNLGSPFTSFIPEQSVRKCQCNSGCFNLDSTKAPLQFEKFQTASVDSQNSNLKILNFDAYGCDIFIGMFSGATTCKYNVLIGVSVNSKIRVAQGTESYITTCDTNYSVANIASKTTYQLIVDNTAKAIRLNVNGSQILNCVISNLDFASITNWAYSGNTSLDGSKSQTICPLTSNVSTPATNCKWRDPSVTIYDQTNYLGNSYTLSKPLLNILGISFTSVKSIKFNPECYIPCSNCYELGTVSDHKCCSCKTNYFPLSDNTSQCYTTAAPPEFYWFSTTQFKPCYTNCSTCSNDGTVSTHNCLNCKTGYYKISSTSNCVNSTPSNYYFNTNSNEYRPCYSNCNTCSADGTESIMECLTCKSGFYTLIDNSKNCYNSTPQFYFYDTTIQKYNNCYSTCNTCSSTGVSDNHSCLVCKSNYFKMENTNNCFISSDTIPKYFYSSADNLFKSCPSNCNVCSNSTTCTTCITGYYKIMSTSNCVNSTPSNYYFNTNTNEYRPCYTNCNTCTADGTASNMECLTCISLFYPLIDNSKNCFNSTPQFYFYDTNIQKYNNCYSSCNTCSSSGTLDNHNCLICKTNYFKMENTNNCYQSGTNVPSYYFDTQLSKYMPCNQNCLSCDSTGCLVCLDGFILNPSNKTCTTCYPSCSTCNSIGILTDQKCNACKPGYYKVMSTQNCLNAAPTNYYLNTNMNEYKPCYSSCSTCSADGSSVMHECLTCKSAFYPLIDNSNNCYETAPNFYFFDSGIQKYNSCFNSCTTCSSSGTISNHNCSTCKSGFFKVENTNDCYPSTTSLSNYYFNSTLSLFKSCPSNCEVCTSSTECTTCINGFYKKMSTQNCLNVAPTNYYLNTNMNEYRPCYSSCSTCSADGSSVMHECLTCKSAFYPLIDNSKNCYDTAPNFYYFDSGLQKYNSCFNSCNTCSSTGTSTNHNCSTCKSGFFKVENTNNCFISTTSLQNYYFNSMESLFKSCPSNCEVCTSSTECTTCINGFYKKMSTQNCLNVAPTNYYLNTNMNEYRPCYSSCSTCSADGTSTIHECLTCKSAFYPLIDNSKNCYDTAPNFYYFDSGLQKYNSCFNSCNTCSSTGTSTNHNCSTCKSGFFKVENTNNCFISSTSLQNYYFNSMESLFKSCSSNCEVCSNSTTCSTCSAGFTINHPNTNCVPCHSSCGICSALGTEFDHKCDTCKLSYFFKNGTKDCFIATTNITSFYFDTVLSKFMPCSQDCLSCDLTGCLACSSGFIVNPSDKLCTTCYSSCHTCNGIGTQSDHKCTNCKPNYFKQDLTANCFPSTNLVNGYYYNSNLQIFKECPINCTECTNSSLCTACKVSFGINSSTNLCTECYNSCLTCTLVGDSNDHKCTTCKSDYFKQELTNNCFKITDTVNGHFNNNDLQIFKKCPVNCTQCLSDSTCSACTNGFGINSSTKMCTECYETCSLCSIVGDANDHKCTTCKSNLYFKELTNDCFVSTLKIDNFFFDSNTNKFLNCISGCRLCSDQIVCNQCQDGFSLKSDKTCFQINKALLASNVVYGPSQYYTDTNCFYDSVQNLLNRLSERISSYSQQLQVNNYPNLRIIINVGFAFAKIEVYSKSPKVPDDLISNAELYLNPGGEWSYPTPAKTYISAVLNNPSNGNNFITSFWDNLKIDLNTKSQAQDLLSDYQNTFWKIITYQRVIERLIFSYSDITKCLPSNFEYINNFEELPNTTSLDEFDPNALLINKDLNSFTLDSLYLTGDGIAITFWTTQNLQEVLNTPKISFLDGYKENNKLYEISMTKIGTSQVQNSLILSDNSNIVNHLTNSKCVEYAMVQMFFQKEVSTYKIIVSIRYLSSNTKFYIEKSVANNLVELISITLNRPLVVNGVRIYKDFKYSSLREVALFNVGTDSNQLDLIKLSAKKCSEISADCRYADRDGCLVCIDEKFNLNHTCVLQCPNTYYANVKNCEKCFNNCEKCTGQNYDKCTLCSDPYVLNNTTCQNICPDNTFSTNRVCKECTTNCQVCFDAINCKICLPNYFLFNGKCYENCNKGFYKKFSPNTCEPCETNCLECTNLLNCQYCNENYLLLNGICKTSCPATYWADRAARQCKLCIPNCDLCPDSSNCTTCSTGFLLQVGGKTCLNTCPVQTASVSGACVACSDPKCEICTSTDVKICTKCLIGLYLKNSECVTSCGEGYYLDSVTNTCIRCSTNNCITCTSDKCFNCVSGQYVLENTTCVTQCPDGYIQMGSMCQKCTNPLECKTCQIQDISKCTTCYSGKLLLNWKCLDSCPVTYYANNPECDKCITGCDVCNDKFTCTKCSNSFLKKGEICVTECGSGYTNVNGICTICTTDSCDKCDPLDANQCLSCKNNGYLYKNTCYSICPLSTFPTQNFTCEDCLQGCELCTNKIKCAKCVGSLRLQDENKCQENCNDKFVSINGKCTECINPSCKNCLTNLKTCTSCPEDKFMYKGSCFSVCPDGTFTRSRLCLDCVRPCKNCSSENSCITCMDRNYLWGTTCTDLCPDGTARVLVKCMECQDINCKVCNPEALDSCQICKQGWLLLNGICVSSCPEGFYSLVGTCLPCLTGCKTCVNDRTCAVCRDGLNLLNGYNCVAECPVPFVKSEYENVCIKCRTLCKTCLSTDTNKCTSCASNSFLIYKGDCVSRCPDTTWNSNGECVDCSVENCATCEMGTKCTRCINTMLIYENTCISPPCPEGYSLQSRICQKCSVSNCKSCPNTSSCTECKNGNFLFGDKTCESTCPLTFFKNTSTGKCEKCLTNCSICSDNKTCSKCVNNFALLNNTCVQNCPANFTKVDDKCLKCVTEGCLNCNLNVQVCNSCIAPLLVFNNTCVKTCPIKTYNQNGICLPCLPFCDTCSNNRTCLRCESPRIMQLDGTCGSDTCPEGEVISVDRCRKCSTDVNCKACDPKLLTRCLECKSPLLLHNNTCVQLCPTGFYESKGQCLKCITNCSKCLDSLTCEICLSRFFLQGNNKCQTTCNMGFYALNNRCLACDTGCENCLSDRCTRCASNLFLENRKCVSRCSEGRFVNTNKECLPCPLNCNVCTGPTICQVCNSGYFTKSAACVATCGLGYVGVSNTCMACGSGCDICNPNNDRTCTKCKAGNVLYNGVCQGNCPKGFFKDTNSICQKCIEFCDFCKDTTTCMTCSTGYFADPSGKLCSKARICNDGFKEENGNCVLCNVKGCRDCSFNKLICSSCTSPLLNVDQQACVTTCPTGRYKNVTTCDRCPSRCATCTSMSICTSCYQNFVLKGTMCS